MFNPVALALATLAHVRWLDRLYWTPTRWGKWADSYAILRRTAASRRAKLRDKRARVAHKIREQVVVRAKSMAKDALAGGGPRHSS